MSDTGESETRTLSELRKKIDTIDAEMHRLLIERGTAIDSLIRTKGTNRPGAAFRPAREADMMRRLVARHDGGLPLTTVEHIWREIISTFTRMQAPFDIVIDASADGERMRDLARFYFGFSVRLVPVADAEAVVAEVSRGNDLGIIARDRMGGAWWRKLAGVAAPRIMAMLPFIAAERRPADLPAFVVAPQLADPTPPDFRVFAVVAAGDVAKLGGLVALAGPAGAGEADRLIALPATVDAKELAASAARQGITLRDVAEVGGFARGIAVGRAPSPLYEAVAS